MAKRFSNSPAVAAGGLNRIVVGGRFDSRGSEREDGLAVVVVVVKTLGAAVVVVVSTGRNAEPVRGANCAGFAFGGCKSDRTTVGCLTVVVVVENLVVVGRLVVDLVVVLGTDLTVVLVATVEVVVGTVFLMLSFLVKKFEKS